MNILLNILAVLGGIIALVLLLALFMRKEHYVKREIVINAPRDKVFEFVRHLKNQDAFNSNAQRGKDRKRDYRGTDGTVGFVYAWSGGKDAGEGEKEIMAIVEGQRVESEIRFVKPMKTSARIVMETEPVSDKQTKVSWSNAGRIGYPFNVLIPVMEKALPKDMDASLAKLKGILEAQG